MKRKIQIVLCLLLCIPLFLNASSPSPSQGVGQGDFKTGSGGEGNSKLGQAKWQERMSGYRFTIVDCEFQIVSVNSQNAVDILFSDPPVLEKTQFYHNSRVRKGDDFEIDLQEGYKGEYLWENIIVDMNRSEAKSGVLPPFPMQEIGGKIVGQGEKFRDWMMEKISQRTRADILINTTNSTASNLYYFNISGFSQWREEKLKQATDDTQRAELSEKLKPTDYMQDMGYNLLVEPILWYEPVDSSKSYFYGKFVYGSVSNLVQWYLEPGHEKYGRRYVGLLNPLNSYENHGGLYSNLVSRVGKACMTVKEDIYSIKEDGTKGELLVKSVDHKDAPLHQDGHVNLMSDIKKAITGKIGNGERNLPYGYAMHFYYLSKKPKKNEEQKIEHHYNLGGKIIVSSDEFDVSKEQPVDEDVKIEAIVDSPIVLDYQYNRVDYDLELEVTYVQPYSDGTKETWEEIVSSSGFYYEIKELSCFKINHVSLKSKSLQDQDKLHIPIILDEKNLSAPLDDIDIHENQAHLRLYDEESKKSYRIYNGQKKLKIYLPLIRNNPSKKEEDSNTINYNFQVQARNDHIQIGDEIMMDGSYTNFPLSPKAYSGSKAAKYEISNYRIPKNIKNGKNHTGGEMHYILTHEIGKKAQELKPLQISGNDVWIFTPVGMHLTMKEEPAFDQRSDQDLYKKKNIASFPINKVIRFELQTKRGIEENPEALSFPHYVRPDARDTERFMSHIELYCKFPVYASINKSDIEGIKTGESFYYPQDSVIRLDKNTKRIYIKPANWACEGKTSIVAFSIAKNQIAYDKKILGYRKENVKDNHNAAFDDKEVDITGRLYDLTAYHFDDPSWMDNYEKNGYHFVTGKYDFNGKEALMNSKMLQFPIKNGKNMLKGRSNLFPRLGYGIELSIKSIGDYYYANQVVELSPSYYIIDSLTQKRVEVDLYVKGSQGYERYENATDKALIMSNILHSDRSAVKKDEIKQTQEIYMRGRLPITSLYDKQVISENYKNDVNRPLETNFPKYTMLRVGNRIFRGKKMANIPKDVDNDLAYACAQQWYGRFYIPNSVVALRKGDDIRKAHKEGRDPFIKDGLLIVNMKIRLYRGGDNKNIPRLEYINSSQNSWVKEGYFERMDLSEKMEFPLESGDILVFDLSKRATDRHKIGK